MLVRLIVGSAVGYGVYTLLKPYIAQPLGSIGLALLSPPLQGAMKITSPPQRSRERPTSPGEYRPHKGVDIGVPTGTPVFAVANGTIIRAVSRASSPDAGDYLELDIGGGQVARYLHLSKMQVKAGETVKAGQQIGLSGSAGTGPHLHFEIRELRADKSLGLTYDPIALISGDWVWKSDSTKALYESEKSGYGSW